MQEGRRQKELILICIYSMWKFWVGKSIFFLIKFRLPWNQVHQGNQEVRVVQLRRMDQSFQVRRRYHELPIQVNMGVASFQ